MNSKLFVLLFYFKNIEICILKDALFLTYIDSRAHPASYPMGTRGSFPGDKVAGA
jgi:hypothetical protein